MWAEPAEAHRARVRKSFAGSRLSTYSFRRLRLVLKYFVAITTPCEMFQATQSCVYVCMCVCVLVAIPELFIVLYTLPKPRVAITNQYATILKRLSPVNCKRLL